jgi:hypothetical protein
MLGDAASGTVVYTRNSVTSYEWNGSKQALGLWYRTTQQARELLEGQQEGEARQKDLRILYCQGHATHRSPCPDRRSAFRKSACSSHWSRVTSCAATPAFGRICVTYVLRLPRDPHSIEGETQEEVCPVLWGWLRSTPLGRLALTSMKRRSG